jgi:hypothetical protein
VFLLDVVRRVAVSLNVADLDLKGRTELMGEILQYDPTRFARLRDFVIAYVNWYYFHSELEHLGTPGNLDKETQDQLQKRIAKRDQARAAEAHFGHLPRFPANCSATQIFSPQ